MLWSDHTRRRNHHSQPSTRQPQPVLLTLHQSPRDDQVKQARVLNPSLIRCYSVRPIFLGCCVLAIKMTREHTLSLIFLQSLLEDVFNLLDVERLILIESQLLEVLSSQPAPNPQPRSRAYVAP
jgi:hypothetical protein